MLNVLWLQKSLACEHTILSSLDFQNTCFCYFEGNEGILQHAYIVVGNERNNSNVDMDIDMQAFAEIGLYFVRIVDFIRN